MLEIRKANIADLKDIIELYDIVIDDMRNTQYDLGWEKDMYPSHQYIKDSIINNELYIGVNHHQIVSAMMLNHHNNEEYQNINWLVNVNDEQMIVIHTLAVLPVCRGQGIAKEMVKHAISLSKQNQYQSIRLDVLEGNIPAMRLYEGLGFQYLDTIAVDIAGEDLNFLVYELNCSNNK